MNSDLDELSSNLLHLIHSAMSPIHFVETDRSRWTSVELGRTKLYTCESSAQRCPCTPCFAIMIKMYRPAVLILFSADHWWPAEFYLVVREQGLLFILQGYKHTNRQILAILQDTIFSCGPRSRDKMCKLSLSFKSLRTAAVDQLSYTKCP